MKHYDLQKQLKLVLYNLQCTLKNMYHKLKTVHYDVLTHDIMICNATKPCTQYTMYLEVKQVLYIGGVHYDALTLMTL